MKKDYVVTFLFNNELDKVWLIEKQKPEWQKGCLNGIGGKIEAYDGEPIVAAQREMMEEAGCNALNLQYLGYMEGVNNDSSSFRVEIFTGKSVQILKTQEEEEIKLIPINEIKSHKHIENVPALIELCLYKLTGHSNFKSVKLEY